MTIADQPGTAAADHTGDDAPHSKEWHYRPDVPLTPSGLFVWPPNPKAIFETFAASWLKLSEKLIFAVTAIAMWFWLAPALERCRTFAFDWIAQIYVRNLAIMILFAGAMHLWFYTYKGQGKKKKFDPRDQAKNVRTFTWNSQVLDNMFWSLASGVTVWTLYEVTLMWGYANGYAPMLLWSDNPVWFIVLFPLVSIWTSFHFYWIHRFLHWPPLYRLAHALHHRNVNVGPWSGLSMHPIEHVLYLSSFLIHWVVATHPIHLFFHCLWNTVGAASSHTGYESMIIRNKKWLATGYFFHQLHHRYFECNYGNAEMPWDTWFGSYHDGTDEANEMVKERRRRIMGGA
ncbi:MAG: sterol desaturase family protein [Hyphomicrobiaceae bacterium]